MQRLQQGYSNKYKFLASLPLNKMTNPEISAALKTEALHAQTRWGDDDNYLYYTSTHDVHRPVGAIFKNQFVTFGTPSRAIQPRTIQLADPNSINTIKQLVAIIIDDIESPEGQLADIKYNKSLAALLNIPLPDYSKPPDHTRLAHFLQVPGLY